MTQKKTLRDIIERWWDDIFTTHSDWSKDVCIDDLIDQIEFWNLMNKKDD